MGWLYAYALHELAKAFPMAAIAGGGALAAFVHAHRTLPRSNSKGDTDQFLMLALDLLLQPDSQVELSVCFFTLTSMIARFHGCDIFDSATIVMDRKAPTIWNMPDDMTMRSLKFLRERWDIPRIPDQIDPFFDALPAEELTKARHELHDHLRRHIAKENQHHAHRKPPSYLLRNKALGSTMRRASVQESHLFLRVSPPEEETSEIVSRLKTLYAKNEMNNAALWESLYLQLKPDRTDLPHARHYLAILNGEC